MTIPEQAVEAAIEQFIENVCIDVAELPDRTSPDDRPEWMLVSADELESCLRAHLPILLAAQPLMGVQRPEDVAHYPVGHILSVGQLAAELRIAAERLEICGAPKEFVQRFYALADAVLALPHAGQPQEGELVRELYNDADRLRTINLPFSKRIRWAADALALPPPVAESGWQEIAMGLAEALRHLIAANIDSGRPLTPAIAHAHENSSAALDAYLAALAPPHIAEKRPEAK